MRHLNGYQFTIIHPSLLFVFLLVTVSVCGQQRIYTNQQQFGVEEGLPQSYIKGITQDKDGFVWIATLDGLSRYDGRAFKNFRSKPGDTTSLSRNAITYIIHQADNKISLKYEGLFADEFDMQTFIASRHPFLHTLSKIEGALWNAALVDQVYNGTDWLFPVDQYKGVGWLNCKTGKVTYANKANGLLQQDTISAFLQTADGRLYLVSEDGVQVSDAAKTQFTFIRFPTSLKRHSLPQFREQPFSSAAMALLSGNRLLVNQADNVFVLDLTRKTAQPVIIPAVAPGAYHQVNGMIQTDSKGQPYFVNNSRIFRITERGSLELLWQNTIVPYLNITACYVDRSDVLWVSVNAQGITKVDLHSMPFQSFRNKNNFIADILEWAGTTVSALPAQFNDPAGGWFYFRQARDNKGRLYASVNPYNRNEIIQLDKKNIYSFSHVPKNTSYSALVVMPDDEIRAFDEVSATWYCWKNPGAKPDIISLDKKEMENIQLADARFIGGYMWLSTYSHGLLQYQDRKRINQFVGKLSNGNMPGELTEICPDPVDKNRFWIGSRGGGLILWDVGKGLQKVYTIDDGLPNNTIYCILPDKSGKIWCSTNKGIFRLSPATGEINSFEKWDGLPGNEFNRTQKFLFPDGRIAFGGLEGHTIFNPADFDKPGEALNVAVRLTSLQINNEQQDWLQPGSIIKEPLSTLSSMQLPYDKNYLRFEFAAMLFNQPQKTKYRYKMEGNTRWIENGTSNVISYAALRPGKYKLLINATDNNGNWSNTSKELAIIIDPPFWATWWAYIIYALMAAGLARWYFFYREKRIKTEQNLAFEKREALRLKEMDEVKDRFFSNITHEFRTPLTLIITPLEKLMRDDSIPAPATQTLKTIQKNSHQLLRLINELLDFSKLNDGRMKVKLFSGELSLFIANCVQSFETAALEKNIRLSYSSEEVEGFYLFDEEKWEKIITNLISNALKFTPRDGMVSVSVAGLPGERIRLEVNDSGPGIPADQQQKIFERFYQADSSSIRNYGGTGIGLSLVKELVELMNGTIEVYSIPGNYSTFIAEIPVQKVSAQETVVSHPVETATQAVLQNNEQEGPLVMIVEDNDELRSLLIENMHTRYRVIAAADGLQAWEMITTELPDIVISDVMMPGRDGFELCRFCKSDNRTAHIGFILLTSKATHDARIVGLETGADGYITKPFHFDELELSTANLLQLQQKVRSQLQAQLLSITPQERLPEVTDPFLLRLYEEMDAKIDEPELGLEYLCKAMAMSRSTLNRKLKSLLDISPSDLIRQYRLQKATGYLAAGMDIATTAYKVGFSSHSYFSQCFREQYGITPSDYVSRQG